MSEAAAARDAGDVWPGSPAWGQARVGLRALVTGRQEPDPVEMARAEGRAAALAEAQARHAHALAAVRAEAEAARAEARAACAAMAAALAEEVARLDAAFADALAASALAVARAVLDAEPAAGAEEIGRWVRDAAATLPEGAGATLCVGPEVARMIGDGVPESMAMVVDAAAGPGGVRLVRGPAERATGRALRLAEAVRRLGLEGRA